jgi:hypothetical protein
MLKGLYVFIYLICLFYQADAYSETPIDQICAERITLDDDYSKIPYCRNSPLGERNEIVERALIVIHGTNRNAKGYYDYTLNAAIKAGSGKNTIILAPQFLIEDDVNNLNLENEIVFWSNNGWKGGDESQSTTQHPRSTRISSFSVIDTILNRLSSRDKFPNLKHIVIAGHSAGGQFVNRFAAGSMVQQELVQKYGIKFRYVIANSSSYLYFNEERIVKGTSNQFAIPDSGNCSSYNQYKYGLKSLNEYMSTTGVGQIISQYPKREVIYMLGSNDNDPNDIDNTDLDTSCAAMFQGAHRLERGQIYHNYILHFFQRQTVGNHRMVVIPNVAHSANGMFNSECGVRYLFDYNPKNLNCGEDDTQGCFNMSDNLEIMISCAKYKGIKYQFTLNYISDLYWKMDLNTLTSSVENNCLFVEDNLKLSISCAEYGGNKYGFEMNYFQNSADPLGFYWEMDWDTLIEK